MNWLYDRVCLGWFGSAVSTPLTPTHTQFFGKSAKIYCMTRLVHCNRQMFNLRTVYGSMSISTVRVILSMNTSMKSITQGPWEVPGSEVLWIPSVGRLGHTWKNVIVIIPLTALKLLLSVTAPPLQTRKWRVVLGTSRTHFPPSH